jgi:hypothetical protein
MNTFTNTNSHRVVDALIVNFEKGEFAMGGDDEIDDVPGVEGIVDVAAAASLMKKYLRDLTEPLIPYAQVSNSRIHVGRTCTYIHTHTHTYTCAYKHTHTN